jgi:hypothetical protein
MPPKDIYANLEATLELAPDIIEDLLASVDQPLKEMLDTSCNRPFLICDYNRFAVLLLINHLTSDFVSDLHSSSCRFFPLSPFFSEMVTATAPLGVHTISPQWRTAFSHPRNFDSLN